MRISICLPVMGRPQWLRQALLSFLIQDYDDLELVVKDGDPNQPVVEDKGVAAVLSLLGQRVNYRCSRDRGIFDAANDCLKRATGDILNFACSDDLLCPGALVAVNQVFEQERFGGPFWLYGKTISADITGKTLGIDGKPTTYEALLKHNCVGQPSTFWNRKIMEMDGIFDPRYRHAADYDLWLRFWRRTEPYFLDQTLGIFRHHEKQNTTAQGAAVEVEARKISTRHQNFGSLIQRARNAQNTLKYYREGFPESQN